MYVPALSTRLHNKFQIPEPPSLSGMQATEAHAYLLLLSLFVQITDL